MKHAMIDIETWGTYPGCAIRSIAAITFEIGGQREHEFYENILYESCKEIGLIFDSKTKSWWEEQSKEAQQLLYKNQKNIKDVLKQLNLWWNDNKCIFIWSHGSVFDIPILEAAMRTANILPISPWKYNNIRDTRTLYDIAGPDMWPVERVGIHHNALDDAHFQIDCVIKAYKVIKKNNE